MTFRLLLVGALTSLLASTSLADVTGTGSGSGIPDDGSNVISTITITEDEEIMDVSFCIDNFDHTWVGDLVVTVTHVDTGSSATLFNRVGRFGTTGPGDSSDLSGSYAFEDGGDDFWVEAANNSNNGVMAPGTYEASDIGGNAISLASAFDGESTAGTWRLTVSDDDLKEVGSFGSWSVKFLSRQAVPEPSTLAFLGLATLVGGTIRRRRQS